jgi:hypothetical protein
MNAKQLFFERYNGFQEYPVALVKGMTEEHQRRSPYPEVNPIAWILWHTARCEDVGVNRLVADLRQVLDDGGWSSRLRIALRHVGTGMTKQEVNELCDSVSLPDLEAYRAAVTARTEEVVERLPAAELTRELSVERLGRVLTDEGAGGPAAAAIVEAYAGHTKGWLLGHLALTHNFYHIGQAFVVRALYGLPNPW